MRGCERAGAGWGNSEISANIMSAASEVVPGGGRMCVSVCVSVCGLWLAFVVVV